MDCDSCNDRLLDFLYEELDETGMSTVREHLQRCVSCTESCERLAATRRVVASLRLVDAPAPGPTLRAALQAQTSPPNLRLVAGPAASIAPEPPGPPRGRFPRWMQRVGEVAMRRQVAMAAVFLLMVGFGLSYHQLQAPTRPLPTSDDPGPMAIPARPVSTPSPAGASLPTANDRRPPPRSSSVDRATDHRTQQPSRANIPQGAELSSGGAPLPSVQHPVLPSPTATETLRMQEEGLSEPPATHRSAPRPMEGAAPNPMPTGQVSGSGELEHGTPSLPSLHGVQHPTSAAVRPSLVNQQPSAPGQPGASTEVSNHLPEAPLPSPPSEAWRRLQQRGDTLNAQGRHEDAIEAWRHALAANPPPAERRAIALRLVTALQREGRAAEASEVQSQNLSRTTHGLDLEGQVPSASVSTSSTRPSVQRSPARPMPSRSLPMRRNHQAPVTADSYSNLSY